MTIARDTDAERRLLRQMARKYVWWLTPKEAELRPDLAITQVMDLGDYDDVLEMESVLGRRRLVRALQHSQAGQLSMRSWFYWHYRLGLAKPGKVPPPPRRHLR